MKRLLVLVLILATVFSLYIPEASAADNNVSLTFIKKDSERREYMETMIDHYLDNYPELTTTLKNGNPVILMFEGGSDNVDDSTYKNNVNSRHASAVCIVLRYDENNAPYVAFYNEYCSTLPDSPLAYGAFDHGRGSEYGTATIKDGIYSFYTTNHKGDYAGFNVRDSKSDSSIYSIYMKSGGYKGMNASGINIHTRTSSYTSKTNPWSAGCLLIGANKDFKSYNKFIKAAKPSSSSVSYVKSKYNSNDIYKFSKTGAYAGKLIVDRYLYRDVMINKIYKSKSAVNSITKFSVDAFSNVERCDHTAYSSTGYCKSCGKEFPITLKNLSGKYLTVKSNVLLKKRPYSASETVKTLKTKNTAVSLAGSAKNAFGNLWYQLSDGSWVYNEHVKKCLHAKYSDKGYCTACGTEYALKLTELSATYVTTKDNVPIRKRPYAPNTVIKRLSGGTKLSVIASAKNSVGNLWYQLSDKTWVYSGNVKKLPSTLSISMTKTPASIIKGKIFNLEGTVSSNYNLKLVTGEVFNADGKRVLYSDSVPSGKKLTIRTSGVNKELSFGKLSKGSYRLVISAKDSSGKSVTWKKSFTVK